MASPSNALPRGVTPIPSTDGFHEIELLPSQDDELFGSDDYYLLIVIGGPGSGKTTVNALHVVRWGDICTELPYAIFANTWDQMVNAILPGLYETFAEMGWIEGRDYVMGKKVPKRWRKEWRRKGIRVPVERASGVKMLVLRRTGVHIYLGTYANQSWRRIKGQSIQAAIGEEITEPDVNVRDFLTYLFTRVRCGHGARCAERGHFHRIILKGNVPLHNPTHAIYPLVAELKAKELARSTPFFRLLEVDTRENIHLSEQYVPALAAGLDSDTFEEQVSGKLERRMQSLTYYAYSEANILPTLEYHPLRDLHMWFDFNKSPASSGFGHDLLPNEVPVEDLRAKYHFGIVGEFFSGADPVDAYRHALALLDDPAADPRSQKARCMDCRDNGCSATRAEHVEVPRGFMCTKCAFSRPQPKGLPLFCSSKTVGYESSQKYIHAPSNWHGLINHRGRIYVYGDASGKNETAGTVLGSPIKILKSVFGQLRNVQFRFKEGNPPITLRELAVNVGLRFHNGTHAIFIHPRCVEHIADLEQVEPDPKTGHARKEFGTPAERAKGNGYWLRGHSLEGFGYHIDWRFPFLMPSAGGMPFAGMGGESGPLDTAWPHP